jgi:hypothetical protein
MDDEEFDHSTTDYQGVVNKIEPEDPLDTESDGMSIKWKAFALLRK